MLLLMLFYSASSTGGVRKLWEIPGPRVEAVASVAKRRSLPSPSSLSRALGAAEFEFVPEWASWLLAFIAGIDVVLRHPAVMSQDAHGEGRHVYELDPTVKAFLQRDLPTSDELPEPKR